MSDLIVTIEEGKLQGSILQNYKQENLFAFRGIPYAEPPIGELRFKAPKPVQPWDGVKDATKFGPRNIQGTDFVGSEDSLTLNVFTKELPNQTNKPKPVMLFVHGGAFTAGDAIGLNPDFLLTQDIVFVSIQYRLGALGFVNFDDPTVGVPGNAGMKDMVLALKWVQRNIHVFCGDANNVTIFGESAGAAAVHYLMISPMSKGLFHKVICESGCVSNPWAHGTANNGIDFAKALGCTSTDSKECLEFLQQLPINDLLAGQYAASDDLEEANKLRRFSPIVEKSSNEEAFMPQDAEELLRSGNYNKVPLLTGNNSEEGLLFGYSNRAPEEVIVPWYYGLDKDSLEYQVVAKTILAFYFGDDKPTRDDRYFNLIGDLEFGAGIGKQVQLHAKTSTNPVYFYRLSETPSFSNETIEDTVHNGVSHGGDIQYIFRITNVESGSKGETLMLQFIKMWTNFARTGNPTPDENDDLLNVTWKSIEEGKYTYLDIGTELICNEEHPNADKIKFWDELDKKYKKFN